MSSPIVEALKRLINSEVEAGSGHYAGLRAFIEPGRGDIYIEGINGQRLNISECCKNVTYCEGEWRSSERTVTPL